MRRYNGSSTVLVTGGAGFLGSHLCDRLIAQGQRVICADNFFTGTKRNIDHLLEIDHERPDGAYERALAAGHRRRRPPRRPCDLIGASVVRGAGG